MKKTTVLSIETSCDETAIAVLECTGPSISWFRKAHHKSGQAAFLPSFRILKSTVASQIKIHAPFGGVVPNLAKREHLKNLPVLYKRIFGVLPDTSTEHGKTSSRYALRLRSGQKAEAAFWKKIDFITVTVGPGLEPALWTGITFAKELSKKWKKPLVGANHLEGHLYSFLLMQKTVKSNIKYQISNIFPAISLIVSGGHTILLRMDSLTTWKHLGETRDDAAGEAFDKTARLLDLPYPGGVEIERLAAKGNPAAIAFPRPMMAPERKPDGTHGYTYDFSFSGLKTSVLYYLRAKRPVSPELQQGEQAISNKQKADIAASFQQAAVDVLAAKTVRAAEQYGAKAILLSGGVAANKHLRATLKAKAKELGCAFFVPAFKYNTDNAVMIAVAGYMTHIRKKSTRGESPLSHGSGRAGTFGGKYPIRANGNLGI